MSFIKEFRDFAMRGNVVDLAIGVVIGAAFGKIVSSLVADVISPFLAVLVGGVKLNKLSIVLRQASEVSPELVLNYGTFLQSVFDFLIISLAIFSCIKLINRQYVPATPVVPEPNQQEKLLMEIRNLLQRSNQRGIPPKRNINKTEQ